MDSLLDHLTRELDHAYHIERELGGGMSRVYVATERALGRRVVLKVLPPDLARDVSAERFKREISLASRLQHAHIVPLLTAGEADGIPWFTMPFVEGESLRARLISGELPILETTRILRDVASALAHAHARGVVHRDLKPENILLSDGTAFVSDFGVAKALSDAGAERGVTFTSVGVALGTPAYMAPEQIAADRNVDQRADIYAFGVVAYEMLSGRNPFMRRSTQATMAAHMTEMPNPVSAERASTPPGLADLVGRCLAKSPADRPQHAAELVSVLDSLATPSGTAPLSATSSVPVTRGSLARWAAGLLAILLLATGAWIGWKTFAASPPLDRHRVAVVPFDNLTGDSSLSVIGPVAAEELSRSIAQTDSADVVSSAGIRDAIGPAMSLTTYQISRLARATRAAVIVTGSYTRVGDSLRVQASVIDARSGRVVRALDPSTGPIGDPMIAIGGLRERLLGSIVSGDAARSVALGSAPPKYSAYVEMLEGQRMFVKDQRASRQYFVRAIELDSTLVPAYGQLAATYTNAAQFDEAERVIAGLRSQRTRLSSYDRLVLEFLDAHNHYVADQILPLAQEVYARGQDPLYAYLSGYWALRILRPDIALHALELSDSLMTTTGWTGQARDVAMTYHQLGDFHGELAALERGSRVVPAGAPGYRSTRLRAYAGLHDFTAALALADTLLREVVDPDRLNALSAVQLGAREFAGHGDTATAARLVDMELAWLGTHPRAATPAREMAAAVAWFDRRNLDSSETHFRQIKLDSGNVAVTKAGYLGVIAALRGDTARARTVADSLGRQQRKWDLGLSTFWRAAISAHLGGRDEAIALLGEARRDGQSMTDWHTSRALWPLRGYAPFEEMITPKR